MTYDVSEEINVGSADKKKKKKIEQWLGNYNFSLGLKMGLEKVVF